MSSQHIQQPSAKSVLNETKNIRNLLKKKDRRSRQKLLRAVKARNKALKELISKDPATAVCLSLSDSIHSKLKRIHVTEAEQSAVTIQGKYLQGVAEDFMSPPVFTHYLEPDNNPDHRVELHFAHQMPTLTHGQKISVTGLRLLDQVAVSSVKDLSTSSNNSSARILSSGVKKVAVIMFNRSNDPQQPFTVQQARDTVYGSNGSVRQYFEEATFGRITIQGVLNPSGGDVFGWYTVPSTAGSCDLETWASAARAAAAPQGYNASNYDLTVYVFPYSSCFPWAGLSSGIYINGYLYTNTVAHEMGHRLGLAHASSYTCTDSNGERVALSNSCSPQEYGDPFDVMGAYTAGHFSNYHKGQVQGGVFSPSNTLDVTTSGIYTVAPIEPFTTGVQSLRIPREFQSGAPSSYYYLEARQPYGSFFDNFQSNSAVVNGVSIRMAPPYSLVENSKLIDATPETASFWDSALPIGRTFEDVDAGIQITTQSISAAGATVSVHLGTPLCVHSAPVVSLLSSNHWGNAGDSKSFMLKVTNTDTSTCGASVFRLSPSLPQGWSQSASSDLTISPGQSGFQPFTIVSPSNAAINQYAITERVASIQQPQLSSSVTANYYVTQAAQTLSFISPSEGATLSGPITLAANSNITFGNILFSMDNTSLYPQPAYPGPYSISFDSHLFSNGRHVITAFMQDSTNGGYRSVSINVTINNPPPTVTLTAPTDGALITGGGITLSAHASGVASILQINFIAGPYTFTSTPTSGNSASVNSVWDSTPFPDGVYTLRAQAVDAAGLIGLSAPINIILRNHTFVSDTSSPTVSVLTPSNGSTTSGNVSLTATASDNIAVGYVKFLVDGQAVGSTTSSPYSVSFDTRTKPDGVHTVQARAYDTAGNVGNSTIMSFTINNAAPLCPADFNGVNGITTQDIFDYINVWFLGDIRTDFNHNGTVEMQDLFDFLNAWLTPCH